MTSRCTTKATLLSVVGLLVLGTACTSDDTTQPPRTDKADAPSSVTSTASESVEPTQRFDEQARSVGLVFNHYGGATEQYFFPEIMGSGGALLDYDNDGDLDVYLVQSARINDSTALLVPLPDFPLHNRLYQNRLVPDGELAFTDVTEAAGVGDSGYGMGVAVADVDNNGFQDLFVSNVGPNALYLNQGNGKFTQVPLAVNALSNLWSTSASFLDYNNDGLLDLFIAQYVHVDRAESIQCFNRDGSRDYCSPDVYRPAADLLLRGDGTGSLTEVQHWQHNPATPKTGLGVVAADYDGNGSTDLYVANDKKANLLWLNRGDETFSENAVMSGAAYNANGKEEASMGVTSADVDGDGDEDLFLTHLKGETNTYYKNLGDANFVDATINVRLSSDSIPATGFGTRWFDMDNDGDLDLFVANGAVIQESTQVATSVLPYAQHNQLFENAGEVSFRDVSLAAGLHDTPRTISRGAAFGDIDNDGDIDILVTNNNGPTELLINQSPATLNWLSLRLQSDGLNRDGIGSRIAVERLDGTLVWRRVGTDGSYLSANDLRTHFGLGANTKINAVQVHWHSGEIERFTVASVNQHRTLIKGEGTAVH